jgi:hypothetical protein
MVGKNAVTAMERTDVFPATPGYRTDVAVTVAVPRETAVASPVSSTLTMLELDELHSHALVIAGPSAPQCNSALS